MSTSEPFGTSGASPNPDANTPPSGQWSQGPSSQVPPTGGWQQPAPRPSGFFNSLRYSGWYRGDNRVIGGVCSGIAARTGWDLALVRGLTVVLAVFIGPVLVAYGLYWAFLPEQRDGRIHVEELFQGHFDAAQLGALVLVLLGLGNSSVFNVTWGSSHGVFWSLVGIAIVAAVIIAVIAAATSGSRTPPVQQPFQVPPVQPTSPGPQPGTFAQSTQTPPTQDSNGAPFPGASPQQTTTAPPWSAPAPRFVPRRVSTALTLSITGLVVLLIAAGLFAMYWLERAETSTQVEQAQIMLVSGGVCLLVVGIALAVASIHDRGAGGLIALSIVGVLLAIPASLGGVLMMRDPSLETFSQTTSGSYGTDSYDWTTDEATSSSGAGSVVLDLTGAPQDTVKTIDVDGNIGEIEVLLRQDQPVSFDINGGVGTVSATYWTDADGSQVSSDWVPQVSAIYDSLDFRNDAWTTAGGITVDVDSTLGNVSIVEKAPASQEVTPTPKTSTPGSQSGAAQSGASSGSPTTSSSATTDDQH